MSEYRPEVYVDDDGVAYAPVPNSDVGSVCDGCAFQNNENACIAAPQCHTLPQVIWVREE